jgi:hypothetical protein
MLPTRTAREMPIFGSYGLPLEMSLRMVPNEDESANRLTLQIVSAFAATGYEHIECTWHRQNPTS